MIRIDEIYNHTFWPWIKKNLPGQRMFFCDPFGHTGPNNLFNHGSDLVQEADYIFFHDQEPIQLDAHKILFHEVVRRNNDITPQARGTVIVSELGANVDRLCDIYGWRRAYYFFHGWACLDWYRGYDRTFLFPPPRERSAPSKTFMSPNRIIAGDRDHRVLFAYHCIQNSLVHNYISCPRICPHENIEISAVGKKYSNTYPDISQILDDSDLPWLLPGESTQIMTSCWLSNFQEATESLLYVPTETVFFGARSHLTEKTFKAIALGMPFVLVAAAGSLEYLRSYGFRTYGEIWDEGYDTETDDLLRLEKVVALLCSIDQSSAREREQIWRHSLEITQHNWDHFYRGGFEAVLWRELAGMLDQIRCLNS